MVSVEAIDENHAVGRAAPVVICLWRHETTVEAIRGLGKVAARAELGSALLTVVELGAAVPSSAARDELGRVFASLADTIACSALVFEGTGFVAAGVRAIATTIAQVSRAPFPHRVFSSVEQAGAWLETFDVGVSTAKLVDAVGIVRSALDAREAPQP